MTANANAVPLVRDRHLLGMVLFIASESIFFLAVVVAYAVFRSEGLATAKAQLDIGRTALFSVLLFASSGTMAVAAGRRSPPLLRVNPAPRGILLLGPGLQDRPPPDAGIPTR